MWFGEPHPFPERGSPTRLGAWGQQSYEGDRVEHTLKIRSFLLFIYPTTGYSYTLNDPSGRMV